MGALEGLRNGIGTLEGLRNGIGTQEGRPTCQSEHAMNRNNQRTTLASLALTTKPNEESNLSFIAQTGPHQAPAPSNLHSSGNQSDEHP